MLITSYDDSNMRAIALLLIRFYQRYLSPLKGFHCAYRCHTGGPSCSALGYRAIRRYGVRRGTAALRMRTRLCGETYHHHAVQRPAMRLQQSGFCDAGCEPGACDVPDFSQALFDISEAAYCCDCGDCGGRGSGGRRNGQPSKRPRPQSPATSPQNAASSLH